MRKYFSLGQGLFYSISVFYMPFLRAYKYFKKSI